VSGAFDKARLARMHDVMAGHAERATYPAWSGWSRGGARCSRRWESSDSGTVPPRPPTRRPFGYTIVVATKRTGASGDRRPRRASKRPERLAEYGAKRDFTKTPEPSGGTAPDAAGRRFVVQRHRARRLHYDFRVEMDGVLVSWAIPKGLSLDPSVKRLGVHVEDHPVEYFDFEGVIPAGEYGGGDVIVWDWGTYEPVHIDDPVRAVAEGELHVDLYGQKLRGRFVLIRRGEDRSGKEQWLVFHKRDEHSVTGWDAEQYPASVRSGRTNDEVLAHPEAVWRGDAPAAVASIDFSSTRADIAALDALGADGDWEFDGVALHLTNLDKVLFPGRSKREQPLTKRDLVRYYAMVAPAMVPYLESRPLNMHRFPNGVDKPGFWHKAAPAHAPEWLTRWHNDDADDGETEWYLVADRPATIAWLANYGAVELHAWTSTIPDVQCPTYAMIDVDPGTKTSWDEVVTLTRLYQAALEHLHVRGFPKLTGRRGIQIWVPIEKGPTFEETRMWVEGLSRAVGDIVPQLVSWKWEKRARGGLARLDYTQNAINKTLVAPYSVRAAAGAPVSMPITWDELDDPELRSDRWTARDAGDRLVTVGDVFSGVLTTRQTLPPLRYG
jgi:bifunctional non-homologous end joining protein LigD